MRGVEDEMMSYSLSELMLAMEPLPDTMGGWIASKELLLLNGFVLQCLCSHLSVWKLLFLLSLGVSSLESVSTAGVVGLSSMLSLDVESSLELSSIASCSSFL